MPRKRSWSNHQLREVANKTNNLREIAAYLGIRTNNYPWLRERVLEATGVEIPVPDRPDDLSDIVAESFSRAEVCEKLGLHPKNKRICKELKNYDTSHFFNTSYKPNQVFRKHDPATTTANQLRYLYDAALKYLKKNPNNFFIEPQDVDPYNLTPQNIVVKPKLTK